MVPLCHCNSCRVYGGGPAYVAAFMPDKVTHVEKEGERPDPPLALIFWLNLVSPDGIPLKRHADWYRTCGLVPHTQHVNSANSRSTRVRQS